MESRIWAFDWYQNRWPWMTLNGVMAVTLPFSTEFGIYRGWLRKNGWRYTKTFCDGVIQCSVLLGPLLFVIFINDIAQLFTDSTCTCKLYADDLKLYTVLDANTDCCVLQSKLNEVCKWSQKWQSSISYTKCSVMYVGNTNCNVSMALNDNVLYLLLMKSKTWALLFIRVCPLIAISAKLLLELSHGPTSFTDVLALGNTMRQLYGVLLLFMFDRC